MKVTDGIVEIVTAVIGVAILAVIFSAKAQTSGVITSAGDSLAAVIKAAVSPVT